MTVCNAAVHPFDAAQLVKLRMLEMLCLMTCFGALHCRLHACLFVTRIFLLVRHATLSKESTRSCITGSCASITGKLA